MKSGFSLFFLGLICLLAYGVRAFSYENSYMALLTPKKCREISHSSFVETEIDSAQPRRGTFNLFYFTVKKFDSKKPSILFIEGGPGGLALKPHETHKRVLANFNVVYFHIRGGGCSQLPNDAKFDPLINSDLVVEDMEAIRKNLGIDQWHAVYGTSYGTEPARIYAHKNPTAMQMILLDGTVVAEQPKPTLKRIFSQSLDRLVDLQRKKSLKNMTDLQITRGQRIIEQDADIIISNYTQTASVLIKKINGEPVVLDRSNQYLYAHVLFPAMGVNNLETNEIVTRLFFGEFYPELLRPIQTPAMKNWLELSFRQMFTFAFPDYDEVPMHALMSYRSFKSINNYGDEISKRSFCSSVPIYSINGTADMYTSLPMAKKELLNKSCYRGAVEFVEVEGAGHNVFQSDPSGDRYLRQAISGSWIKN